VAELIIYEAIGIRAIDVGMQIASSLRRIILAVLCFYTSLKEDEKKIELKRVL